MFLETV